MGVVKSWRATVTIWSVEINTRSLLSQPEKSSSSVTILENTDIFVEDIAKHIYGRIQITTNSFRPYLQIVRKHLLERLDFATMQKIMPFPLTPNRKRGGVTFRPNAPALKSGCAPVRRDRTESARCLWSGPTCLCAISISALPAGVGPFLKVGKPSGHHHAIGLFVAAYNFCKIHSTLGCTPTVGSKLANEAWTIEKLIEESTI